MASHGIRDRVAIVGMGCTPFREHWDRSLDDLLIEAHGAALASAGIAKDDVDAYWYGTSQSSTSGISHSLAYLTSTHAAQCTGSGSSNGVSSCRG